MTSIFDAVLAPGETAIDTLYADAEGWAFAPMRRPPNGRPQADPARAAATGFRGVFDDPSERLKIDPTRRGDMLMTPRVSSEPALYLLDGEGPATIRQGDRLTRLATGKVYEATRVEPDGVSRRRVSLVAAA